MASTIQSTTTIHVSHQGRLIAATIRREADATQAWIVKADEAVRGTAQAVGPDAEDILTTLRRAGLDAIAVNVWRNAVQVDAAELKEPA